MFSAAFCFSLRQLRELRSSSVTGRGSGRGSVGSLSPILSSSGSPHAPHHSPAGIKRRPASFHARTPRTPRPNDLKVTPISRMLNTPTSVDSLPRLRRFTSSQTQLCAFAYLGHDEGPRKTQDPAKEKEDEKQEVRSEAEEAKLKGEVRQTRPSEVVCQPVTEIQGAAVSQVKGDPQDRRDLVEVSLSGLKPPDDQGQEAAGEEGGDNQKICCGFFFKVGWS